MRETTTAITGSTGNQKSRAESSARASGHKKRGGNRLNFFNDLTRISQNQVRQVIVFGRKEA
jgi:hypothetical protein